MNKFRASFCAVAFAVVSVGATLPATADTTMPTCAAGDSVVWENSSTKVYHAQGDKFFGHTKAGAYACKSDADKAGFHLSKSKMKASADGSAAAAGTTTSTGSSASAGTSTSSGAAMSSGADPAASPMMHKKHHKGMMPASPAPGAMASPAAMMSPGAMASPMGKHHRRHKGSTTASPDPSAT